MSPVRPHVILGGGQDAMSVTTTTAKGNKFEARFFHQVFETEIGRVKGHFGPINTLAFHPNGRRYDLILLRYPLMFMILFSLHFFSFSSGGEDGFIRIHHLDPDYFDFKYSEESFDDLDFPEK
jgi:translation initiation factor 3 subunit I